MNVIRIGPHVVRHGDIMDDLSGFLPGPVDFVYTDLPWGNLKYWATMEEQMSGRKPREVSLDDFLTRIFSVIHDYSKPETVVFMEYGQRWRQLIAAQAARIGLTIFAIPCPTYGSAHRPHDLFIMAYAPLVLPSPLPHEYITRVEGSSSYKLLLSAFSIFPDLAGKTVFDPCCGSLLSEQEVTEVLHHLPRFFTSIYSMLDA